MNPEKTQYENRSFLVGSEPSTKKRLRPGKQWQKRLFAENDEVLQYDEDDSDKRSSDENSDSQTSCESKKLCSNTDSSSTDCARVFLRLRPLKSPSSTYVICKNMLVVRSTSGSNSTSNKNNAMEKHFSFTDIFDPNMPQATVYENCVRAQIEAEESFTLLTYGTSGSGKTFTLLGDNNCPGMIPRAIEQIFTMYEGKIYPSPSIKLINGRVTLIEDSEIQLNWKLREHLLNDIVETYETQQTRLKICNDHNFSITEKEDVSVLIWVSFVEIYNENVYDLLDQIPTNTAQTPMKSARKSLRVVGNDGKVYIKGVNSVYVRTSVEALHLLRYGLQRVTYASTSINTNSSRSHCIFFIDVLKFFHFGLITETLYKFCDLAGSERLDKTGNVGSRLKEAQRINSSLLVLGRCLDAATSRKKSSDIIPYRESKLTVLLQAALLGKEKLTMIVNVMPTEKYYEENMNVLSFASIAQNIAFKQPAEQQKQRCSFFLEYAQSKTATANDEQIILLRSKIDYLSVELDSLRTFIKEERSSHAFELLAREQEIRMQIYESNQTLRAKMKEHFEVRLKVELKNQKVRLEGKFEKIIRQYRWEIEDLRDELEEQNVNKRHTL